MTHRKMTAAGSGILAILLLLTISVSGEWRPAQATPEPDETSSAGQHLSMASYPGGDTISQEIREPTARRDGYFHIDTRKTIVELKRLHVTTFYFLIWHSPSDWRDLTTEFMPAAQAAGIDVLVYIVPPSECKSKGWCSEPFRTDYVKWATEIARLSKTYPAVTAWAIDDFTNGENSKKFTDSYMKQIDNATEAINPDLDLYTTAYYKTATDQAFYEKYSPYIDGIVFPYLSHPVRNTQRTSTLRAELSQIQPLAHSFGTKLELMIYAGRWSAFAEPTADYVKMAMATGMEYLRRGSIDGIVAYGTPHRGDPAVSSDNLAMYGTGSLVFRNYGGETPRGTYQSASQTVRVDPRAPRYTISCWIRNAFYGEPAAGREMQILIDNHVVWSPDVTTDRSGGTHEFRWTQIQGAVPIDKSYLRGKSSARLTIRMYQAQQNTFRSTTSFDTLQSSGFGVANSGFERDSRWRLKSTDASMVPAVDHYDAQLPTHVFDAVSRAYAR